MSFKNNSFISAIIIFGLSFITHNLYKWFPNDLFAILFPVNESAWEHMKIIYTTSIIYNIFEFFLKHKHNNSYPFAASITSIFNVLIYLLIYIPLFYIKMDSLIVDLVLLYITLYLSQNLKYRILKHNSQNNLLNYFAIFLIIICFIIFGYFTYNPPKNDFFLDKKSQKYGINIYIV